MFVINLQQALDLEDVGAKAANLAKAMEMGLSVPRGSVITRQALSLFLEETGLLYLRSMLHLMETRLRQRWERLLSVHQ